MKVIVLFLLVIMCLCALCQDFVCDLNVPYRENDCNKCFCSHNQRLACLNRVCNTELSRKLENCVVGTKSKVGCNSCVCVDDIGTVCTNNKC